MPSSEAHRRYPRLTPSPGASSSTSSSNRNKMVLAATGDMDSSEYTTTRRVKTKTTRNTERQVRKRLVLPDGRVIAEMAEPEVMIDTVEDTQSHHEEGGGPFDLQAPAGLTTLPRVSLSRGNNESSFTRRINTRDVRENVTTTAEGGRIVGQVRRKDVDRALRDRRPIADLVRYRHRSEGENRQVATQPKVLYSQKTRKKVVDTEDVRNVSRRTRDGRLLTETVKTHTHEVFDDKESPTDDQDTAVEAEYREGDRRRYRHRKDDDYVEYYASDGRLVGRGPRVTGEERRLERREVDDSEDHYRRERKWEELSEKVRRNRQKMRTKMMDEEAAALKAAAERRDALTKRPLNYVHEEKVKKKETNKWLERHFGSEWSVSNASDKSQSKNNRKDLMSGNNVRRSISFTSIPIVYQGRHEERRVTPGGGEEVTTTKEKVHMKTTTKTYRPGEDHHSKRINAIERLEQQTRGHERHNKNVNAVTHSLIHHYPERSTAADYRKYNSTQCLLPTPQVDFSLHGGSTVANTETNHNGSNNGDYYERHHQQHQHNHSRSRTAEGLRRTPTRDAQKPSWHRSQSLGNKHHNEDHHQHHQQFVIKNNLQNQRYFYEENSRSSPSLLLPPPPSPFQDKQLLNESIDIKKVRRIYPTVERGSVASNSTANKGFDYYTSFASEMRSRNSHKHQQHHKSRREEEEESFRRPLYVTELKREKLYPATSENNLVFDYNNHYNNNKKTTTTAENTYYNSRTTPRNYLGFRSLERSDAVTPDFEVDHHHHNHHHDGENRFNHGFGHELRKQIAGDGEQELLWWSERREENREIKKKRRRKRSQSFAAKASPR